MTRPPPRSRAVVRSLRFWRCPVQCNAMTSQAPNPAAERLRPTYWRSAAGARGSEKRDRHLLQRPVSHHFGDPA
jgi:hypothetical protein